MGLDLETIQTKPRFLQYAEFYTSLQGEGSHSGLPCFFIRSAVCDIRCTWCDTPHALGKGKWASLEEILQKIPTYITLVQITGGEPLVQEESMFVLMETLVGRPWYKKVILETGGHRSLKKLAEKNFFPSIHVVMDIKLPASGEAQHDFAANFSYLKKKDEIKFVIQDLADFEKAVNWVEQYNLQQKCQLLFSPVWGILSLRELAQWLLAAKIQGRVQAQLHKIIWDSKTRGV